MQKCKDAGMQKRIGLVRARGCSAFLHSCILALLVSGCARASARSAELLPLDTPEAPPRIVEASEPGTPQITALPDEPARTALPRPRPQPPAQRAETPRQPEPPKPDVPADAARPPEEAVRPPATLQTTPAQQEGEVERRIRALMAKATGDLGRVNYQNLNADGRTQYDTAKRFVSQADEALKVKNLVFANNLADKAAQLAAELAGR
jgi:hypothetical protein